MGAVAECGRKREGAESVHGTKPVCHRQAGGIGIWHDAARRGACGVDCKQRDGRSGFVIRLTFSLNRYALSMHSCCDKAVHVNRTHVAVTARDRRHSAGEANDLRMAF